MTTQFEQDQQAAVDAAQREQNLARFHDWITRKHPEIKSGTSITKLFEEYADFGDHPLIERDFEFMLGNLESRIYSRQHVPTPEEIKAQLIDKICEMIASKNGGQDGKFDKFYLQTERKKMAFWSIQQLTTRLDEIVRKQSLNLKPLAELKSDLAETRKAERNQNPYFPYERLPFQGIPSGKIKAVAYSGDYIKRLPASTLQKWAAKFSFGQLNDRINGRDMEFEEWNSLNGRGE